MGERVEYTLEGFLFHPSQDGGLEILQVKNIKPEEVEQIQKALNEESQIGQRPEDSILWKYFVRSDDTLFPVDRLFRPFIPEDSHPIKLRITIEEL